MNIDFIKWKTAKAGFKIVKDQDGDEYVYYTDGQWCSIESIEDDEVLNGYLLQRAIEGVNRDSSKYFIGQSYFGVGVYLLSQELLELYEVIETQMLLDNAKESALKYIFEQESK